MGLFLSLQSQNYKDMPNQQQYIDDYLRFMSYEDIKRLAKEDICINNVIRGICDKSYGVVVSSNKYYLSYIFYNLAKDEVEGFYVELGYKEVLSAEKILAFAKVVSQLGNDNVIDIHNVFCLHLRSALEKEGVMTISSEDIPYNKSVTIIAKTSIAFIPMIQKKSFYKSFFSNISIESGDTKENKVYLMYDFKTDQCKIGYSKNPLRRERTLQSEKPTIELLAYWTVPKSIEKELHIKFASKRTRGGWFYLDFNDFEYIKQYMQQYM